MQNETKKAKNMSDATNNTPMLDKNLYSRVLHVLQNYSIIPEEREIALVRGVEWRTAQGWKMAGRTTCQVLVYNLRTNKSFWIRESFASEDERIMLRTAGIGDIIAYNKNGSDITIIQNFDAESRFNAVTQAFADFSRSSK